MIGEGGDSVLSLDNFSGGISDFPVDGQNVCQKADNFLITAEGKLRVRPGSNVLDPTDDAGTYLWPLGKTATLHYAYIGGDNILLTHASEKVFKIDGALIELQAFNNNSFFQSTAQTLTEECIGVFQTHNEHIYGVAYEKQGSTDFFISPRKMYRLTSGAYETINAGLPYPSRTNSGSLLADCIAFANLLRTEIYTHMASGPHAGSDTPSQVAVCTDRETLTVLVRNLYANYNDHTTHTHKLLTPGGSSGKGTTTFTIPTIVRCSDEFDAYDLLRDLKLHYNLHIRDIFHSDAVAGTYGEFIHTFTTGSEMEAALFTATLDTDPYYTYDSTLYGTDDYPRYHGAGPLLQMIVTLKTALAAHAPTGSHAVAANYTYSSTNVGWNYLMTETPDWSLSDEAYLFWYHHLMHYFSYHRGHNSLPGSATYTRVSVKSDLANPTVWDGFYTALQAVIDISGAFTTHIGDSHAVNTGDATARTAYSAMSFTTGNYAFYFQNQYTIFGGVTNLDVGPVYVKDLGPKVDTYTLAGTATIHGTQIANLDPIEELDNFPINTMEVVTARKDPDSDLYYVANRESFLSPTTGLAKTYLQEAMSDANLILQDDVYTNDGSQSNSPPPKCRTFAIVNNTAFYGCTVEWEDGVDVIRGNRIRQSIQNDIDSCPESFYVDVPREIITLGSTRQFPIAVCDEGVFRIEGLLNSDGSGSLTAVEIDKTVGGISYTGGCTIGDLFFFAAKDGVYYTDGYKVQPCSLHLDDTWKKIIALDSESRTKGRNIKAAYNQFEKRIYFACSIGDVDYNDSLLVLDLNWPLTPRSSFTVLNGMRPTALTFYENRYLVRGDTDGFVFQHDEVLLADQAVDRDLGTKLDRDDPIEYDFLSGIQSFGSSMIRKYLTTFSFVLLDKAEGESFKLSCTPYFVNDKGKHTGYCRELDYRSDTDGFVMQKRHFPAGHLRCLYKQVGFKPATKIISQSDDATASLGYLNKPAKSLTLDSGAVFANGVEGKYLYLASDGYTKGYEVLTLSPSLDTILVDDPDGTLPATGNYAWTIEGVPTDERMEIVGITIPYSMMSRTLGRSIPTQGNNL